MGYQCGHKDPWFVTECAMTLLLNNRPRCRMVHEGEACNVYDDFHMGRCAKCREEDHKRAKENTEAHKNVKQQNDLGKF